jgi:lycopene beta-cyclase
MIKALTSVRITGFDRLIYALVALWVLAMISVPILNWTLGEQGFIAGVMLGVVLQIAAVMAAVGRAWGIGRALAVMGIVVAIAWLFEYIGHNTGFPFGDYYYTDRLQPQIGDVPILVPLAWLMMLPPAWAVAAIITRRWQGKAFGRLAFIGVSALTFTAWDLFLDPQMVSWRLWLWENPGDFSYFGIPWVNYAGWLLVSVIMTAVASLLFGSALPNKLPLRPLLVVYVITWALQTIGQLFFWGLPGPALVGCIAMGACLLAAWRAAPKSALTPQPPLPGELRSHGEGENRERHTIPDAPVPFEKERKAGQSPNYSPRRANKVRQGEGTGVRASK